MSAPSHQTIRVGLDQRAYDIQIGAGLLENAAGFMQPVVKGRTLVVVTDETVAGLHLDRLMGGLAPLGLRVETIILPPGEEAKSFASLEGLLNRILGLGIERSTMLVALGGGVIGDLVGFAASILLRGIDFIQIPTTLLSQVDSSVGGKTGINTPQGKNLVGSFHQPRLVLADTTALSTLPRRELLAGYAEVVKYGLLGDEPFFTWLESHGEAVVSNPKGQEAVEAVLVSCRAKADVVARDEKETGDRALLNLGHTFGHALEAEGGYGGAYLHGEAVAIGMVMAFDLSSRLGLCPADDAARARAHLAAVGLPVNPGKVNGRRLNSEDLLRHMTKDKKVKDGRVTFILARGIGKAFTTADVDPAQLKGLLDDAVAA